jgi:hypothetical protein
MSNASSYIRPYPHFLMFLFTTFLFDAEKANFAATETTTSASVLQAFRLYCVIDNGRRGLPSLPAGLRVADLELLG